MPSFKIPEVEAAYQRWTKGLQYVWKVKIVDDEKLRQFFIRNLPDFMYCIEDTDLEAHYSAFKYTIGDVYGKEIYDCVSVDSKKDKE